MPKPSLDHLKMRQMMEVMDAKSNEWTAPPFTGIETYHDVEMRDGFKSSLKIQKPADAAEPGALIVLCFGGGFVGGSNEQFSKLGRVLVNMFGATVVSISYRLAPGMKTNSQWPRTYLLMIICRAQIPNLPIRRNRLPPLVSHSRSNLSR